MEDRQSSYFSTAPTPRKDPHSSVRQPSAMEKSSGMEPSSRMESTPRIDQTNRFGQQSAIPTNREAKIIENNGETKSEDLIDNGKSVRKKKPEAKGNELRQTQIYRKRPIRKENKSEEKEADILHVNEIKKQQFPYPIPKPPPTRKADIFKTETAREIDRKVLDINIESFLDIKSLCIKLTNKYFNDVEKVRSIFAWICTVDLNKLDYSRAINDKSPLHFLQEVKNKKSSYSELFETMCKAIDISCHVVTGVAKLENHEIGESDVDEHRVSWNVVYVADGWRIVFLQWALDTFKEVKKTKSRQPSSYTESLQISSQRGSVKGTMQNGGSSIPTLPTLSASVKDDSSLNYPSQQTFNKSGIGSKSIQEDSILKVNEYYFLTDPDEFIFRCFPDQDAWQLLGKPYTIEKFLKLPILSPIFFQRHLKISSRLSGIRKVKNGSCIISVKRLGSEDVFFQHSLELAAAESPDDAMELDLKRLVAVVHDERKTHFHMWIPVVGMFDFKLFGGETVEDLDLLCSFKIRCDEPKIRFKLLPVIPEIGFGPSPITARFGMRLVSNVSGLIKIRGPDTVDIDFKLAKDVKVIAEMVHDTIPTPDLQEYISLKQHNDDLFITVGVPRNGEYVLKLLAKYRRSTKDFINVCNFLLMSEDPKKPRKPFENAADLMIRQQLMNTLKTSKNPDDVQMAIDRLNKEDLPDDGWLTKAYERLEYLKLARALRGGINRKNAEVLEKAIQNAKQSNVADKLQNYISEGETMLQQAAKNPVNILDMKRTTVSEVHRYKRPKPVMFNVMKATYVLLGERPESLSTWDEIVYLMRLTSRDSLLYRVKQFDQNTVDQPTADTVHSLLKDHTLEEARLASSGVGTFYTWASDVVMNLSKNRQTTQSQQGLQTNEQTMADNYKKTTEQKATT